MRTHKPLLPEDKLNRVRQWQAQNLHVAFIGDGINDAPALAAAGTDAALETSDIAFLNDDLSRMPEIVDLSRRTLRAIRQNIAFSILLNIFSVILGACNPQLAHRALSADRAIGMLLSCNVVLRGLGENVEVSILDPEAMFSVVDAKTQTALATLPGEAKRRLQAVLDAVKAVS